MALYAKLPTYLNEILGRDLFQAAGLPVARATHARVELNGRDAGLYVFVEGYDKTFLRRHFKDANGNLYDSGYAKDIDLPLKKGSGNGPGDHSDLEAMARLAAEPDPDARLTKLSSMLDLDRFYSFLALELMTRHHDGYSISKNNYWLYHDPSTDRFIFLAHGMDQLFWQPRASLFPELEGIVSKGVLESARSRPVFRDRCANLFTNFFPRLTNRVEELQRRLRPVLTLHGTNAVTAHVVAVKDLHQRIVARCQHLQQELIAPAPRLLVMRADESILVTNWTLNVEHGNATALANTNDNLSIRVRIEPTDKPAIATWQTKLFLPKGSYRISVSVAADRPVFLGPTSPATLRVWGMNDVQLETNTKDPQHADLQCGFLIQSQSPEEALIQCEVRASDGIVTWQLGALVLARVE